EEILMSSNLRTANTTFLVVSTALLLACVLAVSNASAGQQERSETVKFKDLNMGTPAGAEALFRRIHSAARRVCAPQGWSDPLRATACTKDAEARAVAEVNLPLLTAYYRNKTGDHREIVAANR